MRRAEKIARKRITRATHKIEKASFAHIDAETHLDEMIDYYDNAVSELAEILEVKNNLLKNL